MRSHPGAVSSHLVGAVLIPSPCARRTRTQATTGRSWASCLIVSVHHRVDISRPAEHILRFLATNGANAAGLTYLRVPLGASDFSANGEHPTSARVSQRSLIAGRRAVYSFDDVDGDTHLNNFDIGKAPSYLFSTIKDIQGINPYLRVHLLPWSPVRSVQPITRTLRSSALLPMSARLDEGQRNDEGRKPGVGIHNRLCVNSRSLSTAGICADSPPRFQMQTTCSSACKASGTAASSHMPSASRCVSPTQRSLHDAAQLRIPCRTNRSTATPPTRRPLCLHTKRRKSVQPCVRSWTPTGSRACV